MTRPQATWLVAIGAAAAVALVVVHAALLPADADWRVNRILHHVWQGVTAAAAAGGGAWLVWPRPKARIRRDEDRQRARRRTISLVALVVAAVLLVAFAEIRRETSTRGRLAGRAADDLQTIARALNAYAADHPGARPDALADLAPKYLDPARLYYAFRHGPAEAGPPADPAAEPPSYALAKEPPATDAVKKRPQSPAAVYLRPGLAWAPMTAILARDGRVQIVGEDAVRSFEKPPETP